MEKFVPYEKLSKKEKRKLDLAKRQTWGELNPVTRKPENSKVYNRKKSQAWKRDLSLTACDFFLHKFYNFSMSPYVFNTPQNEVLLAACISHQGLYRMFLHD